MTATHPAAAEGSVSALPAVERRAVLPAGFRAGGLAAGIKASGRPDMALVATTAGPAAAAAVFTPNAFAAAPVRTSQANLTATSSDPRGRFGWAEAVISTSGSANAATGVAGDTDQATIGRFVAETLGIAEANVLHLSTGIIGTRLPLEVVRAGLERLAPGLSAEDDGLEAAAIALRTTDSVTKLATTTVELDDVDGRKAPVTVSGIAKGVGMIHPRMATMLSVVLTDATVAPDVLWSLLRPAAARTWDQLSVDGDTSTNDTVFVLASGASAARPVVAGSEDAATLGAAIEAIARDLAAAAGRRWRRGQHADHRRRPGRRRRRRCAGRRAGRGLVQPRQGRGARSRPELGQDRRGRGQRPARRCAGPRGIRALGARGHRACRHGGASRPRSAAHRDRRPRRLRWRPGRTAPLRRAAARAAMEAPEVILALDLGLGCGHGEAFGCDLTETYVIENSEYTT